MNELQIFDSPEFGEIRTITEDGKTLFCGKDVAEALGYKRPADALSAHCKGSVIRRLLTKGGEQNVKFISQGDVYRLAAQSTLPGADRFESWIFDEVLPSIHRQGAYLTSKAEEKLAALVREAVADELQELKGRVEALEDTVIAPSAPIPSFAEPELSMLPPGGDLPKQSPGKAAQRRWMRTASEKLELLSTKFHMSNNRLLHSLYRYLEDSYHEDLTELRHRVMEEQGLDECSTMKAIFYSDGMKEAFEKNIDYNLAPENRGW